MYNPTMGSVPQDHDERIARLMDRLAALQTVTADTREEVLAATEQLIERALESHRLAVEESRRARAEQQKLRSTRAVPGRSVK